MSLLDRPTKQPRTKISRSMNGRSERARMEIPFVPQRISFPEVMTSPDRRFGPMLAPTRADGYVVRWRAASAAHLAPGFIYVK
jgi:hypothetical protein